MGHYLHEEINNSLLKLYHKSTDSLPDWDVIVEVARLAEMEPTFENVRFATHLYYVIDDLLHPLKHVWCTIEEVNEEECTISIITHEIYENKVGTVDHPVVIHKPDSILWSKLYSGKSVDVLNENIKAYPISKLASHFETNDNDSKNGQSVHNWINVKKIEDAYKEVFEHIIDWRIPRLSFERFIARLPAFADPFFAGDSIFLNKKNHDTSSFQDTTMPNFLTEIRETFDKEYVKVLLKDKSRLEEIKILLAKLPTVKNVNITRNKELDLTVYPSKFASSEETQKEILAALNVIFASKQSDPIIIDDVLSGLSTDVYQKILEMVHNLGKNLEKFHGLHSKLDEEGFREYFLPFLNTMSKSHTTTGETFNKIGKTDILIQNQEGDNVFIAECKVWSGEGDVGPAVDQLLERYVTWRDEKLALIIFNKTVKGFSAIVAKAIEALSHHPLCINFIKQTNESCGSFIFRHADDPGKEVRLELLMFNCA